MRVSQFLTFDRFGFKGRMYLYKDSIETFLSYLVIDRKLSRKIDCMLENDSFA